MHKFFLIMSLTCVSLSAMKQEFPSNDDNLTFNEKALYYSLEAKLIGYFNTKLGVNFDRDKPNDPMITRLVKTVVNRAFVLQDPQITSALVNKPKLELSDLRKINWIINEAVRLVLAERRLLKHIITGNSNQPWPARRKFDQLLKQTRTELELTDTHKMHQNIFPELLVAKKPKPVRNEEPKPHVVTRDTSTRSSSSNYKPYAYPDYRPQERSRYTTNNFSNRGDDDKAFKQFLNDCVVS